MGLNLSHVGTYQIGSTADKNYVEFDLLRQGRDLVVLIGGGESHIGSLAVSDKKTGDSLHQYTLLDHREDQIVNRVADRLSKAVLCEVVVIGGIHYDDISRSQIEQINEHVTILIDQMLDDLKSI